MSDLGAGTARRSRGRPWTVLALVFGCLLASAVLVALFAVSQYRIGRVDTMNGNSATVSVAELNRSFEVESLNPDLEVGATVVLNVQGEDAALVATSPGVVRVIVSLKRLIP